MGTPGHANAQSYLIKKVQSLSSGQTSVERFVPDFAAAIEDYKGEFATEIMGKFEPGHSTYKLWDGFTKSMIAFMSSKKKNSGTNIIWEKKGSKYPNEVIIIGANYDSIVHDKKTLKVLPDHEAPGADNNGSGVAVALSMIEVLSTLDLPRTVKVVFLDFEELRFLGSKDFAGKHLKKDQEIAGFINLVMLGHDCVRTDAKKKKGNMKLYGRRNNRLDRTLATVLIRAGKKMTHNIEFSYSPNSFNSSGHISFWGHPMGVLTFTQNWDADFNNERYHTSDDFVETLNMKTLYNSFKYITGSIIAWAYDVKK